MSKTLLLIEFKTSRIYSASLKSLKVIFLQSQVIYLQTPESLFERRSSLVFGRLTLVCFNGVSAVGYKHTPIVSGGRKPKELAEFNWVNTILGNVKTSLNGAYYAFDFSQYAHRHLAVIAYRFNRCFILKTLSERLLIAVVTTESRSAAWLRLAEDSY